MEDWIIGVVLALFVIIPCWLALARRRETQGQVNAWPELAQRTGLIYSPAKTKWWAYSYLDPPSVRGEYRGRDLSMVLIIAGDWDKISYPIYQNTSISLRVRNYSDFSLSIQKHGSKVAKASSGNLDFDRRFSVEGSPWEYVRGSVDLILHSDPRLLAWIIQSYPSIDLKGYTLVCEQNGELTNVDDQLALLNLLCDMAGLAEKMGAAFFLP